MIVGVLLAAGRSSRFGTAQKLVAAFGDRTVVRSSAETLLSSPVDRVIVVLGSDADAVRSALAGLPVTFAVNEHFADGMSGSLRVGVRAAMTLGDDVAAVVVALGDQPTVSEEITPALIARFLYERGGNKPPLIVAARYAGERGHPVLFARPVFPELLTVSGDHGAREVIARDATRVASVDVVGLPPPDVDTPADLKALLRSRRPSP